jgi:3-oxoacyl-[acyl-carrier-protein] synthase-3
LGQPVGIDRLPLEPGLLHRLQLLGLRAYSDGSQRTITDLASHSVRQSLSMAGLQAQDIDAVVLCSSSYWHHEQLRSDLLSDMMHALGMSRANLFLTSLQGCHNAVTGLRMARDLLRSGDARHALVCTVDLARSPSHRVGDGPSILADGAASCILSDNFEGAWQLMDLVQTSCHGLGRDESGANSEALHGFSWLREAGAAVQVILQRNGLCGENIDALVINNYNRDMTRHLVQIAKVPADRVLPFNPDLGHVWSSDTLIGMAVLSQRPSAARPGIVLLMSTGPRYFGAALLSRLEAGTPDESPSIMQSFL